jgi:tetrahydromethanopterin S-methyltransferase subunit F
VDRAGGCVNDVRYGEQAIVTRTKHLNSLEALRTDVEKQLEVAAMAQVVRIDISL